MTTIYRHKLLVKELRMKRAKIGAAIQALIHLLRHPDDPKAKQKYQLEKLHDNIFFIPDFKTGDLKPVNYEEAKKYAKSYKFKSDLNEYLKDMEISNLSSEKISDLKKVRKLRTKSIRDWAKAEKKRGHETLSDLFTEIDQLTKVENSHLAIKEKTKEVFKEFKRLVDADEFNGDKTKWRYTQKEKALKELFDIEKKLSFTGLKNKTNDKNPKQIIMSEFLIKIPGNNTGVDLSNEALELIMRDIKKEFLQDKFNYIAAAIHKDEKIKIKNKNGGYYDYGNHMQFQVEGFNRDTLEFDLPDTMFKRTLELAEEYNFPIDPKLKKVEKWSRVEEALDNQINNKSNLKEKIKAEEEKAHLLKAFGELEQKILLKITNRAIKKVPVEKRYELHKGVKLTNEQLDQFQFSRVKLSREQREERNKKIKKDVSKRVIDREYNQINANLKTIKELKSNKKNLTSETQKLQEQIKGLKTTFDEALEIHKQEIEDLNENHKQAITDLKTKNISEIENLNKEIEEMKEEKEILETYIQTVEPKATKKLNQSFSIPAKERQEIKKFIATQSIIKNKKREEINKALIEYLSNPEIYKPKKVDNENYNDDTILDTLKNAFKSPKRLETQEEINERINNHINNVIFKDFPLNDIKALQEENTIQKRQNKRLMEILKSKSKDIMTRETIETLQQRLEKTVPVKQYNGLVEEFNTINEENTALKATNKTLLKSNTELEKENNTLKGKITEYKAKLQKLGFYFIDQFKAKKDAFIMELFTWKAEQKNEEDKNIVVNCQSTFEQNTMEHQQLGEIEDLSNTDKIDTGWGTNTLKKDKSRKYDI